MYCVNRNPLIVFENKEDALAWDEVFGYYSHVEIEEVMVLQTVAEHPEFHKHIQFMKERIEKIETMRQLYYKFEKLDTQGDTADDKIGGMKERSELDSE